MIFAASARAPPEPRIIRNSKPNKPNKGDAMRKVLIITGLAAATLFGGVACSGTASADDGSSDQTTYHASAQVVRDELAEYLPAAEYLPDGE